MNFLSILLGFAILTCWCDEAAAWARKGHEVVAQIAESLLTPATQSKIRKLLSEVGDTNLVSVSCWADELVWAARDEGPLRDNKEAREFNTNFPNNRRWHFINLPLGTMSYQEVSKFTSPDDIVQAISRCIRILEAPTVEPGEFSKVEALRLLVHFVADLHQPLHCGTGYYSFDEAGTAELISFPAQAFGKANDRGGNLLFYGAMPTEQLHALWDDVIVENIDNSADYQVLADFLTRHYLPAEMTKTPGDYHRWAEIWAADSVRIAALAYLGISLGKAQFDPDGNLTRIEIKLPANYLKANVAYAAEQLAIAGARLAQLLENITWRGLAEPKG
jgi:hypothetical protein